MIFCIIGSICQKYLRIPFLKGVEVYDKLRKQNKKKLRCDKKLSIGEAAEKLNINKGSLSRYENDIIEPSLSMAKKIANFYGADLNYLADNEE